MIFRTFGVLALGMTLSAVQPAYAGYAMANSLPAVSMATNSAMGAALNDALATLGVAAKDGAQIMRAVAKSGAIRWLGKAAIWTAPLLLASDMGLFDQSSNVLMNGNGSTITLKGPDMDAGAKPTQVMPSGGWSYVIQAMGYPTTKSFVGSCQATADCARFFKTWQWACATANQICSAPTNQIDSDGYTTQYGLGLGYANSYYQYVLIGEKLPARSLNTITYTPTNLSSGKEAAAAIPDSDAGQKINYDLIAAALRQAIADAKAANPTLAWPAGLTDAITGALVRGLNISITLPDALAPSANDPNVQWPPGWADARPQSPYWDPTLQTPTTSTTPPPSTTTGPVDLGADPQTPVPTLEDTPTGEMILAPILGLFPDLSTWTVPSHSSVCPTPSFTVWGQTHVMTAHCDLLEANRTLIYTACLAAFAIAALFIALSA